MNASQVTDTSVENSLKVDLECEDNKNPNLSKTNSDILGKYDFKHKKANLQYYTFEVVNLYIIFNKKLF